jgi:arylsulfatase
VKETGTSDTEFDVVIAAYLVPDLAKNDFDALVKLVEAKELEVEAVALVTNDADGNIVVDETGDHLGRKGVKIGGGVGLVVGLLAPPLASVVVGGAVGGLVGKLAKHKLDSGLGEQFGTALPPGTAGIVAIYDRTKTDTVNATLASAVMKSAAEIDGGGATELKTALAEAQAGMGGDSR